MNTVNFFIGMNIEKRGINKTTGKTDEAKTFQKIEKEQSNNSEYLLFSSKTIWNCSCALRVTFSNFICPSSYRLNELGQKEYKATIGPHSIHAGEKYSKIVVIILP